MNVLRRKMITVSDLGTVESFSKFLKQRRARYQFERSVSPSLDYLGGSAARCDESTDKDVGIKDRLRRLHAYGSGRPS